jgi:hypothetical protein
LLAFAEVLGLVLSFVFVAVVSTLMFHRTLSLFNLFVIVIAIYIYYLSLNFEVSPILILIINYSFRLVLRDESGAVRFYTLAG